MELGVLGELTSHQEDAPVPTHTRHEEFDICSAYDYQHGSRPNARYELRNELPGPRMTGALELVLHHSSVAPVVAQRSKDLPVHERCTNRQAQCQGSESLHVIGPDQGSREDGGEPDHAENPPSPDRRARTVHCRQTELVNN